MDCGKQGQKLWDRGGMEGMSGCYPRLLLLGVCREGTKGNKAVELAESALDGLLLRHLFLSSCFPALKRALMCGFSSFL